MNCARSLAGIVSMSALLVVGGCSTPPWKDPKFAPRTAASGSASSTVERAVVQDSVGLPSPTAPSVTSSPTPTPTPTEQPSPAAPTVTMPTVVDDLKRGSAKHVVQAGPTEVTLRYWSTLPKDEWTWGATKPLTIAVSATGEAKVALSSARVAVDKLTSAGWVAVPGQSPVKLDIEGSPSIASPASSTLTSLVSAVDKDTVALRYTFVLSVSVSDWRGVASTYSATDSLTVALATS